MKDVSKALAELIGIQDLNSEIRSPFLYEAEVCARSNLRYASIVMLGLCGEAYLRLLGKRLHKIDKELIPYFGLQYKQSGGRIDEKQIEKLKKIEFDDTRLGFKDIVHIFKTMQLFTDDANLANRLNKSHFEYLADIRNDFAHPNWKDIDSIEEKCLTIVEKLRELLVQRIESIRLHTGNSLLGYIIQHDNIKSPSSLIELIPFAEFSTHAKTVLKEILDSEAGDLIKRLRDFWFHLKQQAPEDEKQEIEKSFTDRLGTAISDEDNKRVEILIELIDWSGSTEFCEKCAELVVNWLYDRESELDIFEEGSLKDLQNKIHQLKQKHFPEAWLPGLNEVSEKIQKKLATNNLLTALKQIAQKDKEQSL